ncbi:hypothetical protein [uncultured Flavobacterium sp.]|uniref:hypothetical protein n=1 Tax=uncultured Flavobacterium sp. TaxID=165435 RepID=UPI0030EBA82F|tara:strand:- start:105073 stop:106125 length:1053 start_codon:yes stop_codon:yes gene_type:complete
MKKRIVYPVLALIVASFSIIVSCSSNDCEYVLIEDINGSNLCAAKNILNISTGIDEVGNVIAPGDNVSDPYWRLINRPLYNQFSTTTSDQNLINTINGNAFIVNYNNSNSTDWINQNNSSSISPVNVGTNQIFSAGTIGNPFGFITPYIFERSFCVKDPISLIIDIEARGELSVKFELVNNATNFVYATSQDINNSSDSWYDTVNIPAGTYSIRAYLIYKGSTLPAFSLVGSIKTVNDSFVLTNNNNNCCSNNIIGLTVISDDDCNNDFDSNVDSIFSNLITATIIDSSGTVVSSQDIDINGNIIFAGLPDGTYTIQLFIPDSAQAISPNNFQVTVVNNEVKNFNIFVCP